MKRRRQAPHRKKKPGHRSTTKPVASSLIDGRLERWMHAAIGEWAIRHNVIPGWRDSPLSSEDRLLVCQAILESDAATEVVALCADHVRDDTRDYIAAISANRGAEAAEQELGKLFLLVRTHFTPSGGFFGFLRDNYAGGDQALVDALGAGIDLIVAQESAARAFCRNLRGHKAPSNWELHKPNLHLMAFGRYCGDLMLDNSLQTLDADRFEELGEPNWTRARDYIKQITNLDHGAQLAFATAFWGGSGFSSVGIAHRLAAALMFTKTPDDPMPPWFGFVVKVPDGLLTHDVGGSLRTMLVSRWPDGDLSATSGVGTPEPHQPDRWHIFFQWERGSLSFLHLPSLGAFDRAGFVDAVPRGRDDHRNDLSRRQRYRFARAHELALNLIGGMCVLMADKAALKSTKKSNSKNRNRPYRSLPFETASYVVAKNVEIDLRPQVQQYVEGGKKTSTGDRKLTCQFPVRGHWRDQAYGPGMAFRRPTWIEPFWKGPQDARILLRGYDLKKNDDGDTATT